MESDPQVAALAASPEVRTHLRSAGTGVYIVQGNGQIVWASPSMKEATGRGPDELAGQNGWNVFVPPEDRETVVMFRAMLTEGDGVIWMRLVMPGGSRAWYRVETWVRRGFILCAFKREDDRQSQYPHYEIRPRHE